MADELSRKKHTTDESLHLRPSWIAASLALLAKTEDTALILVLSMVTGANAWP